MGRPLANKGNRNVTLKSTTINTYKKLLALAATVSLKMGAAVATFATPAPTLANLDTAAGLLEAATEPQGHLRNKGSKAQTLAAQAAANDVRVMLSQLVQYAYNTVLDLFPEDSHQFNATLATSGFSMKNIRKPKHISQPRWVNQTISKKFPAAAMRLNWRRGVGLIKGAPIAGYLIKTPIKEKLLTTAGYDDITLHDFVATGDPTGLANDATKYNFNINVDGHGVQAITVVGSACQTFGDLIASISAAIAFVGATCLPFESTTQNFIRVQSNTSGKNSSVVLTDSTLTPTLISALGSAFYDIPVRGTEVFIPASFGVVASTTRTNFVYNPTMAQADTVSGQIVPFNSLGEGAPINFTLRYVS